MADEVTVVQATVLEYDGERDFGTRCFVVLPRAGETIELWKGGDLVARVEEVRHIEFDPELGGDVVLYVSVKR